MSSELRFALIYGEKPAQGESGIPKILEMGPIMEICKDEKGFQIWVDGKRIQDISESLKEVIMENFDKEQAKPARRNYGTASNIAEEIVREHRRHWETIHQVNFKSLDHQGPVGRPALMSQRRGRLSKTKNHRGSTFELIIWTLVAACLIYLTIFVFGPFLGKVFGKEIDLSVTAGASYNRATWESGKLYQPGGTHKDSWIGLNYNAQIKYRGWIFKDWQPTFEIEHRREKFDFSDAQAPVQRAEPRMTNLMIGITHDFKILTGYFLGGISFYDPRPSLIEAKPYFYHGRNISLPDEIVLFKLGAYRLWEIGPLKIGPEISTEIFTKSPGFSRCRKMRSNYIVPNLGLRVQW